MARAHIDPVQRTAIEVNMFISNKEKSLITENLDSHKFQIDNLVKHVGKLQVDIAKTEAQAINDLVDKYLQLQKMYWGADKKVKALEKQVTAFERHLNTVQLQNEVLYKQNETRLRMILDLNKRVEKLETKRAGRPVGAKTKVVIPAEKVQALKEAGDWDDPIKRINSIDQFIKDETERKEQEKIQRRREAGRRYYAKKKAMKAIQLELETA